MFDALEELIKARKAKGLENWSRLDYLATKLSGKHNKHISFTCAHPKHSESGETHNLGSVEGNLHFLLGYVNPGFHVAPYHWQIIYPDLEDDEAAAFAAQQKHPSKPKFWENSGLEVVYEGDLDEGKPHVFAQQVLAKQAVKARSIKAKARYGSYEADPVNRLIHETKTGKAYKWELIENSYFAAENPQIVEAMKSSKPLLEKAQVIPEAVRYLSRKGPWDSSVYPLIKSQMAEPGSVMLLKSGSETIYGVVTSNSIDFVDSVGNPVKISQYDREYSSIDLRKGGDVHPSIVYNLVTTYGGVSVDSIQELMKSVKSGVDYEFPSIVEGLPSKGWDHAPATLSETLEKVVEVREHTQRLVIK